MKRREIITIFILFIFVTLFFFYKTLLYGQIPFPGDLLIGEYSPWKAYSYLGYVPGSFPNKAQYFDTIRQIYPWKTFSLDLLKSGEVPLWNPYNFSGAPLLANNQSAVFYPLNLFYFLFPQIIAWTILVILQPLLAGFFTYLYGRKIGLGKIGSFFAAIAFSYSLFMSVFLEYNTIGQVILWFPLSLYLIERILGKKKNLDFIFLIISLVLPFLAGHLQLAILSLGLVFLYTTIRIVARPIFLLFGFLLGLLVVGVSAIQLLPTFELIRLSARAPQNYQFLVEKLLLQPYQLILFLAPDLFGNPATRNYLIVDTYPGNAVYISLVSFVFSLFALACFRKNFYVRFFSILSLALLLFLVRSPLTEFFYQLEMPLFSTSSPTNAIFLLSFALSVLCGFGVNAWLEKKEKFYPRVFLLIGGVFLFVWVMALTLPPQIISIRNLIYSTGLFLVFVVFFFMAEVLNRRKTLVVYLFLLITIFDLFYFFQKFNPFVSQELVFPKAPLLTFLQEQAGINRFWGYGSASIEANFATQYKLFSPDGYDPLYPKRYSEFIQSSKEGKINTNFTYQTRSDAVVASGFGKDDLPANSYRLKVLDLLGVKYILDRVENGSTQKTFPAERFKLVYEQDGWRIFENLASLPRVFLAPDYKVFKNKEEFENIFFNPDFDIGKTILLEEEPKLKPEVRFNDLNHLSRGEIESYQPNKVVINAYSEDDILLFLSDTYYPGWKAFIDDRETKIYRANYAFRAVLVPGGRHTVLFSYQPRSFSLGVKTTIISVGVMILFSFYLRKKRTL